MRPDDRAVPFHRLDVRRCEIMPEDEFAACARWMIGAEEKAGHRVRINVTFKPHCRSVPDVQDNAVAIIECGHYAFGACLRGQFEKAASVELVEPWQTKPHPVGVHPATGDVRHLFCFTRQDWGTWELSEISVSRNYADIVLPVIGKPVGQVERHPAEPSDTTGPSLGNLPGTSS